MNLNLPVSRRSFVIGTGAAAASAALLSPARLLGSPPPEDDPGIVALMRKQAASAKITVQTLRGGVAVLMGAGGNMAVLTGPQGKVIVDAGISTAQPRVSAALAELGHDGIRYLINTHWHFDHTDGNQWLNAAGAVIVGHENTRKHLATDTRVEGWKFTFPSSPAQAQPTITFRDELALHLNNSTLVLESLRPAHTDSDILVRFKEADIVHVGDIWWNGHYPFIDYSTGGSIDGTIRAVETALTRVSPTTIIIPGHGPNGSSAELAEFRDMLTTVRKRVADMKQRGQTLDQVVASKPTREFDAKYGHFLMAPSDFVALVFTGV
jgi:glyoxylase-like metal-dependent hydrolase (beta-lactamase superfamily II)